MFDWSAYTLFLYILMRMSGFVIFSPVFSRGGIPAMFRAGMSLLLAWSVYAVYDGRAAVPATVPELALRLLLELSIGFLLDVAMRFFFYIADQAGEFVDMQMGMSMARTYDPTSQTQTTVTSNLLSAMMMMLFFAANGHLTLLRLMLTSGEIIPFGAAALGSEVPERMVELFTECVVLAVKLGFPILGAELLGQVGMGILMKVIPQINVFAINIELKIIIGLFLLLFLTSSMSDFMLEAEAKMLRDLENLLALTAP